MRSTRVISILLSTALATTAFAASPQPGEKLAENQTYTYRLLDDVKSFDPQISTDTIGSEIARDLFEGLMNSAPDGSIVPGMAESFDLSDDKLTYTFHLRDAKWSNGAPVTAGDFAYAWRRLADPATASEYSWYIQLMGIVNAEAVIKGEKPTSELGVKALDDKTLEVTIDAPRPYFPGMLTHQSTFPTNQAVIEAHGADWTKPGNLVGNGAYVLSEYNSGEKFVLSRNPLYWDNDNTVIETVTGLVINDENTALTRYKAGELDRTEVPAGQFPKLSKEMPDDTIVFPRSCSYIYWYNMTDSGPEYLKDIRVRKALAYAIDRDIIVERVLQAGQYPSYNFTHQKTAGFELPDIPYAGWTQDARNEKAKELLAEAGYGPDNPLKVTISYNTDEAHKKVAIAISQFWKRTLGVETELKNAEWKVHLDNMQNYEFELARYAWCGDYNEASTYLDLLTSWSDHNVSGFASDAYDTLMKDSKTSENPAENYKQAELLLSEEMPFAPIYQYTRFLMLDPHIKGFPVNDLMQNTYSRTLYRVAE